MSGGQIGKVCEVQVELTFLKNIINYLRILSLKIEKAAQNCRRILKNGENSHIHLMKSVPIFFNIYFINKT
jgi:hypothetical protein